MTWIEVLTNFTKFRIFSSFWLFLHQLLQQCMWHFQKFLSIQSNKKRRLGYWKSNYRTFINLQICWQSIPDTSKLWFFWLLVRHACVWILSWSYLHDTQSVCRQECRECSVHVFESPSPTETKIWSSSPKSLDIWQFHRIFDIFFCAWNDDWETNDKDICIVIQKWSDSIVLFMTW